MAVIPVEGPELIPQTLIFLRFGILLDPHCLVGGFLGYWLDRWLGWAPYALIGGLILGFAAGVNNAWRAIRVFSDDAAKGGDRLP